MDIVPTAQPIRRTAATIDPPRVRPRRTWRQWLFQAARYAVLLLFVVLFVGPLLWLIFLSLKTEQEFAANPLGLPANPQWGNYVLAWDQGRFSVYLPNTIVYTIAIVAGLASLACMAGYAARDDGCTEWGVFFRVMLSLAAPGLATVAVIEFLGTSSAYLLPLMLVQREELHPAALALPLFHSRYSLELQLIAAAVLITIVPPVLIYLFVQRRLWGISQA